MKLPKKSCQILAAYSKASRIQNWKNYHYNIPKCVLKISLKMPYNLIGQIEIILHLFSLRKRIRIKDSLINILQIISCLMVFCVQYKTVSPWVTTALALISLVSLSWLSWCQQQHIEYLNRTLVELCSQLPSSNIDEESLHED